MSNENAYLKMSTQKKIYLQSKIIDGVANGVVVTDINGNIIYANPYACYLTGYTFNELLEANPRIFKSGEHPKEFYEEMWNAISSGKKWKGEIVNKKKDGTLWVELLIITPIRDNSGKIEFYVGIQQDVTKEREIKKQAEMKIKEGLAELKDFIKDKL